MARPLRIELLADGVTSRPGATEGKPIYRLGRLRPGNWGGWGAVWSMQRSARRCTGLAGDWSEAGRLTKW